MTEYPDDKPTLCGSYGGVPMFSDPRLRQGEMMSVDKEFSPVKFYAVDGKSLNLYRVALGVRALTEAEVSALARTHDGLIIVDESALAD